MLRGLPSTCQHHLFHRLRTKYFILRYSEVMHISLIVDFSMGSTWEKFSSLPKPQKFETATGLGKLLDKNGGSH